MEISVQQSPAPTPHPLIKECMSSDLVRVIPVIRTYVCMYVRVIPEIHTYVYMYVRVVHTCVMRAFEFSGIGYLQIIGYLFFFWAYLTNHLPFYEVVVHSTETSKDLV